MGFWVIMNLRAFCTWTEVAFLASSSCLTTLVPSAVLTVADARTCGRWFTCLATNLGFMEVNFWPSFRQAFSVSVPEILKRRIQTFAYLSSTQPHRVCVVPWLKSLLGKELRHYEARGNQKCTSPLLSPHSICALRSSYHSQPG